MLKYAHNSMYNPEFPNKAKSKVINNNTSQFTIIGNYLSKDFIECCEIAILFHKYKKHKFVNPIIKGVTGIEWPLKFKNLKIQFGEKAYCLKSSVVVLLNGQFLGGLKELRDVLKEKYTFNVTIDYYNEAVQAFVNRVRSSGRPHAYMHIALDGEYLGTFIFMIYADICPMTSENFLRLCTLKRDGYKGTPIHRIVKDGWIQCGGFGLKGVKMPCENYIVPHDTRGLLCMANEERNVDNSTQFFILLQPAEWMDQKYVAFGKLIEGEETLGKIEEMPTYYQSPTKDLVIMDAGILNLECQDLRPSAGVYEYIESHIEDLVELGKFVIDILMESVYLQAKFREVSTAQQPLEEIEHEEPKIHETKRFNKEDIQKHFVNSNVGEKATDDLFAEGYEPEEYSYQHVSVTSSPKEVIEKRPYYLELTNVHDPVEIDSVFDFKRYLRGFYCLESDLETDKKKQRKEINDLPKPADNLTVTDLLETKQSEDFNIVAPFDISGEENIREYLRQNADSVSFAGETIRRIARGKHESKEIGSSKKDNKNASTSDISRNIKKYNQNFTPTAGTILKFKVKDQPIEKSSKYNFLIHSTIPNYTEDSSEDNMVYDLTPTNRSYNKKIALQYGFESRISTDYINTMKIFEGAPKYSIRSIEYARTRPTISVEQYKKKYS